jgi:hypothetical protein
MNVGPEPGPSSHHGSRSRARDFAGISTRELTKLLAAQEREARNLERSLAGVNAQMLSEAERASAAETRTREIGRRLRGVMDARRVAEQDTTRAQEELKLYKIQLQAAAREIEHAQSVLDAVEKDRVRAEEDAANSRDVARRIKEEHLIEMAREEGRRLGLAEGLRRGKQTGFTEGRDSAIQEHDTQQAQDDAAAAEETRKQEEDLRRRQEELARQMEQNDRQREEDIRRQEDEDRARRADEDARRQREDEDARRREREEDERARNEIHPVIVHNEPPTIHHKLLPTAGCPTSPTPPTWRWPSRHPMSSRNTAALLTPVVMSDLPVPSRSWYPLVSTSRTTMDAPPGTAAITATHVDADLHHQSRTLRPFLNSILSVHLKRVALPLVHVVTTACHLSNVNCRTSPRQALPPTSSTGVRVSSLTTTMQARARRLVHPSGHCTRRRRHLRTGALHPVDIRVAGIGTGAIHIHNHLIRPTTA